MKNVMSIGAVFGIVILSIPISYYLFIKNKILTNLITDSNKFLYNFFVNKWYFDELYEFIFVKPAKKIGLFFWKSVDIQIIAFAFKKECK